MPRTAHPCLRARNSSPQGGGTGTEVTPAHHAANTAAISRQKRQQCHSANRNNATAKTATAGDGSQQQTAENFAAGYLGSQAGSESSSQAAATGRKFRRRLLGIASKEQIVLASSRRKISPQVTWDRKGVNHPRKQQQQAEKFAASYGRLGHCAVRCRLVPLRIGDRTTPGRIRTCDLRFRKPPLYPTELRGQSGQVVAV
jgi:hypothetical protein